MKEEDYMKLRCIGPCPENTGIRVIDDESQRSTFQELRDPVYLCSGSKCVGWTENILFKNPETNQLYTSNIGGNSIEETHGFCGLIR